MFSNWTLAVRRSSIVVWTQFRRHDIAGAFRESAFCARYIWLFDEVPHCRNFYRVPPTSAYNPLTATHSIYDRSHPGGSS